MTIETDQTTVVIDPGGIGQPPDLSDVDGVLVTHVHFDHFVPETLTKALAENDKLQIWAPPAVAEQLDGNDRVHAVKDGDEFTVGDLQVAVRGEKHARMHPDAEPDQNVGYLIDGRVFHPGDQLTVVNDLELLLAPVNAPWLRAVDLIEYVREARPKRVVAIHEGLLNDVGLSVADNILRIISEDVDAPAERVTPGTTIEV
ncbi:MBL fold metallo-hydrolase [Epidermidibacterium keratini]|uniref:MBL fold metallo-hydrolase n=1 Tax=Epidermidibacterium keratini TaxID=1891644 RepID=A0A7L4YNY2_9ACTN|nr:MBL fold metallo-hydrolase [Epidermidibacterium keratini]